MMHAAGTYKCSLAQQDTDLAHSRQWSFNGLEVAYFFADLSESRSPDHSKLKPLQHMRLMVLSAQRHAS